VQPLAHIALAVLDTQQAAERYKALGFEVGEPEIIEREHVIIRKAARAGIEVELLESLGKGPISNFVAKRGTGLHHVAFRCTDLSKSLNELRASDILPLPGYPAEGSMKSRVAFLDPKATGNILFELVESLEKKL
jgi:methylmalonyl-CoA/ethylmalonyl-CoA epimerase